MRSGQSRRLIGIVLTREIVEIFRDRRAIVFAVVLPALLWPLFFLFQQKLQSAGRVALEERRMEIVLRADSPPPWFDRLLEELPEATALRDAPAGESAEQSLERLKAKEFHLLIEWSPAADPPEVRLVHLSTSDDSREARRRAQEALETVLASERLELLVSAGLSGDPATQVTLEPIAIASQDRTRAARLALFLPLAIVLVLLSGASFAAIDAFAGERERNTLETLLVHPVSSATLTAGKFLAVLCVGWLCMTLNLASLLLCYRMGWLTSEAGAIAFPDATGWIWTILLFVALSLLLTAVLVAVAGRARTFREGQNYILPLTLVALLPTGLSALPGIPLNPLTALVPLLGPSLSIREVFAGRPIGLSGPLALIVTVALAHFALRSVARVLDAERVLKEIQPDLEAEQAGLPRKRALWVGLIAFFVHYYGALQIAPASLLGQILFSLVIVLPIAGIVLVRLNHIPGRSAFPLRVDLSPRLWLAGLLIAVGSPALSYHIMRLQQSIHETTPMEMPDISYPIGALVLFFAILPALSEEGFFRGAFLASMRGSGATRAIIASAALFAVFHLSIARFANTFALGLVLGFLRVRTGTMWIPILVHLIHNVILVGVGYYAATSEDVDGWLGAASPWMAGALLLGALLLAKREDDSPAHEA